MLHSQKNTLNFHRVDFDTKENNGVTMDVSWDSSYGPGDDIPFEIIFYDPQGNIIREYVFTTTSNSAMPYKDL